jgi:hypothetical protein
VVFAWIGDSCGLRARMATRYVQMSTQASRHPLHRGVELMGSACARRVGGATKQSQGAARRRRGPGVLARHRDGLNAPSNFAPGARHGSRAAVAAHGLQLRSLCALRPSSVCLAAAAQQQVHSGAGWHYPAAGSRHGTHGDCQQATGSSHEAALAWRCGSAQMFGSRKYFSDARPAAGPWV